MLAWVHQATAGESEFLDALFGLTNRRMVGQVRDLKGESEEEVLARTCLDKHLEGLCRPLRVSGPGYESQVFQLTIVSPRGPRSTHHQIARGSDHGLQDREPFAILPHNDGTNHRG